MKKITTTLERDMRELIAQGYTNKGYCYWTAILEKNGETIILERE